MQFISPRRPRRKVCSEFPLDTRSSIEWDIMRVISLSLGWVDLILCGDHLVIHFTSPAKKKGMLGIPTRHSIPLDTRSSIEWTVSHTFCFRRRVVWKNQKGQQGPSTIHRLGEWGAPIGSLDTRSSVEWTIFNHLWSPGGGVCRRRSNDCDFIPIAAVVVVRQKGASVWQR